LSCLLLQLDSLAREVSRISEEETVLEPTTVSVEMEGRLRDLREDNTKLVERNGSLNVRIKEEKNEKKELKKKIILLENKNKLLTEDIEKVSKENQSLLTLAQKRDEDNETISQVLEKISCDYEDLQKNFESQRCPKDDKIKALRNTAKALEAENELLQEQMVIKARDNVNIHNDLLNKVSKLEKTTEFQKVNILKLEDDKEKLTERYNKLEEEKISLLRELSNLQHVVETREDDISRLKEENAEIREGKVNVDESLGALKDCKRVVELKYQNILVEKSNMEYKIKGLNESNELMQVKNQSLEESIAVLEREKIEQTEICAEIQQNLIQKTNEYESQIRLMQRELDRRIDELDVTKKDDVEKVKNHYFELFHEKVSEVNIVRTKLESTEESLQAYKAKCKDLEYREQELSDLVDKIRSNPEPSKDDFDIKAKLDQCLCDNTRLQERIDGIKCNFYELKQNEKDIISAFSSRSEELKGLISDKDDQIIKLTTALEALEAERENVLPNHSPHLQEPDEACSVMNNLQSLKKKKKRKRSKV